MDLAKQKLLEAFKELGKEYEFERLKQDASARVYFRLPDSLAVVYLDKKVPEAGAGKSIEPDEAFKRVGSILSSYGLSVPKVLWENSSQDVYLVDDFGDLHLADAEASMFYAAIRTACTVAGISVEDKDLRSRSLSKEVLRSEMQEIVEFTDLEETAAVQEELDALAEEVSSLEYCFQLRDFHAWNILVNKSDIALIDFQDALMAPKGYDLASLLHDRDTDKLLGKEYKPLLRRGLVELELAPEDLVKILLQRDIKVAGRFSKLVSNNRSEYQKWIPGTLHRIGKSLSYLNKKSSLIEHFPKVAEGCKEGFSEL